jgi:hypothetical protein
MTRVALSGMGAIGTEILRSLASGPHQVVGVADVDPGKSGRTVAELTGLPLSARVVPSMADLRDSGAEVAVFATKSRLKDLAADIESAVAAGMDVVSTSEELSSPWARSAGEAEALDRLARGRGVSIVGVGVNPGFVMDWVPAVVASASLGPSEIHVVRSVDVSRRRRQLQAKTGVGLTKEKFDKGLRQGVLGHVGLAESATLIAASLGEELKDLREGTFPVVGSEDYVMGVRQFAEGLAGKCRIRLDLEMSMTSADFDVVEVNGSPPLKLRFEKGVFGDSATVALVVHAVERVARAPPGLITVLDLPLIPGRSGLSD